jgi:Tol biopolymer transport system component
MKGMLWVLALLVAGSALTAATGDGLDNPRDMARLPVARLLVGYPPRVLALTTGNDTLLLEPPIDWSRSRSFYPGMTRDGSIVAAARWKDYHQDTVVIGTYSLYERRWTDYAEGDYQASVAISSDGSKLAFAAEFERIGEDGSHRVRVINLKTGERSLGPGVRILPVTVSHIPASYNVVLTWSPDGQRLAYSNGTTVEVWDSQTEKSWQVAEGQMPTWSPDGEWIAYLPTPKNSAGFGSLACAIVHADGTDNKRLVKLPRGRIFLEPPVWSPDSKTLLLNEMADGEKWTMNIDLLDLSTLKLKKKLTDKMPVFAWAEAK